VLFPDFWKLVQWRISRLWARGEREASIRVAERYARRRPSDPWAWILWGSRLMHAARYGEAEAVFREAVATHPGSVALAYELADSQLAQSKVQDANPVLERARESHPNSPLPYLGLMSVAKRAGDPRRALILADQAASRIAPDDFNGHFALAERLVDFPERRTQFEFHLRRAATGLRGYAMPHMLLAALLENTDRPEATRQLAAGRRLWGGPDFDHTMEDLRRLLQTEASQGG
jgi:tetratricopeptide (TPR) repeat protein